MHRKRSNVKETFYIMALILGTIMLLSGCSNSNKSENGMNSSCLVENYYDGEIVMCFEGDLDSVQSRCKTSSSKNAPRVTFSIDKGCPRDRGYFGHCVDYDEEYIRFSYNSPSALAQYTQQQKEWNKEIVQKGREKDCISDGGIWYK